MSDHVVTDVWKVRDLPVLRAAATRLDAEPERAVDVQHLAADTGLAEEDCLRAAVALEATYVVANSYRAAGGHLDIVITSLTERGRRTAGLWPSGDDADALIDLLRQEADLTDDPERASALRRAAAGLLDIGRDVLVDVVSALAARQMGLG